jgi:hypothetical protein
MRHRSTVFGLALLLSIVLVPSSASAQAPPQDDLSDLGNALQTISEGYADNYVQPITNTFGAGVNAGLFRSADVGNGLIPGFPLNVYLGVNVSGPLTSSLNETFTPFGGGTEEFTVQQNGTPRTFVADYTGTGDVPTVFGETEPPNGRLVIRDKQTGAIVADARAPQGLLDTPIAPLIIPQLGVGSVFGTDVQVRYFPKSELSFAGSSYGTVGVLGLAVRHDIDQWFPVPLPLNLAIQGAWNQFSLENTLDGRNTTQEVLDASGWAVNFQASKGLPVAPITFYGGVQYETFSVDYDYTLPLNNAPDADISLSQDAENTVRGLVGVTFTAAVVRINVDYAIGNEQNIVTTGLGVRL